jgi:hypothetical protein
LIRVQAYCMAWSHHLWSILAAIVVA